MDNIKNIMRRNTSRKKINLLINVVRGFIILGGVIVCCTKSSATVTDEITSPNVSIYDNILSNRKFVEKTFTEDILSTENPYAVSNGVTGSNYMYKDILDNYSKDSSFATGVNIYYRIEHLGESISEIPSVLADKFLTDQAWSDFIAGAKNKNYNAVLSKVLSSDYQSESGQTLNDELADVQSIRSSYSASNKIKGKINNVNGWLNYIKDVDNIYQNEYVNKVLPEYSDSVYNYINGIDSVLSDASGVTGKDKSSFHDLYEAQYYALYGTDDDGFSEWRNSLDIENFASSAKKFMAVASNMATVSSSCLENIILLESVFQQRDSMNDVLLRTRDVASVEGDNGYMRVSKKYTDMLSDDYIEENDHVMEIVKNTLLSYTKSKLDKFMWTGTKQEMNNIAVGMLSKNAASKEATSLFVSQKAEGVSNILSAATFLGDKVTAFGDTCEKIYELVYLQKIKEYALTVYFNDKKAYIAARESAEPMSELDKLAKNTLDDLSFLKRLTLRENEIGYKLTSAQVESGEGRFLEWISSSNTLEALDDTYKKMENTLVDTKINPIAQTSFKVGDKEKLTVLKTDTSCIGRLTKENGSDIYIPEFEYCLLGGLEVYGDEVIFNNKTTDDIYVNQYVNFGASTLITKGVGCLNIGEIQTENILKINRIDTGYIKVVGSINLRELFSVRS